jgi:FkbM family methyltransferase
VDNTNYSPLMLEAVVASRVLEPDPFVLVDVGCGLGLDPAWRLFGRYLHAHGFEPQVDECKRLARQEKNRNVQYHAAMVGLPDGDPFHLRKAENAEHEAYYDVFNRSSAWAGVAREAADDLPFEQTNDWQATELSNDKVGLGPFLDEHGVTSVDFVKIDTDGADLEVLLSFDEAIERESVLGFMVETPFYGSDSDTSNTFHNIDRLLKRHGFLLYNLSVNRYSRGALPARFALRMLAQTDTGQAMWGDLVFLRDAVGPGHERFGALTPTKLLKLACLYELFRVPDAAAELLVARRAEVEGLVDVDRMLDLLTPPLDGQQLGYREYLAAFAADPTRFYAPEQAPEPPPVEEQPEEPPPPVTAERESTVRRWLSRF